MSRGGAAFRCRYSLPVMAGRYAIASVPMITIARRVETKMIKMATQVFHLAMENEEIRKVSIRAAN